MSNFDNGSRSSGFSDRNISTGPQKAVGGLEHGGGLRRAAQRFGIPLAGWLDLSTGINPQAWPAPPIPLETWRRLPEEGDGLEEAALAYYGNAHLLPVTGSQAAIQLLPRLRPPCRVGILGPAYAEHHLAWVNGGHDVQLIGPETIPDDPNQPPDLLETLDVVVAVNPNNPTGRLFGADRLSLWRDRLVARGGWLVVDEAFMDAAPEESLTPRAGLPGLIVLRSLGKFFGLAGARVGFLFAERPLLAEAGRRLGPWTLTGPSRFIAREALLDLPWQANQRQALPLASERLAGLMAERGLRPDGGTALFQWVRTPEARAIQERLARQGVLARAFDDPPSLRLGLPGEADQWDRLAAALAGPGAAGASLM